MNEGTQSNLAQFILVLFSSDNIALLATYRALDQATWGIYSCRFYQEIRVCEIFASNSNNALHGYFLIRHLEGAFIGIF